MSSYDKELAAVFQKHEVVFNKNLNCDDRKYLELSVKELRYWNWWAFVTFSQNNRILHSEKYYFSLIFYELSEIVKSKN